MTIYDAGDHISLSPDCRCCGQQFLSEIDNPQEWLDAKVAEAAEDIAHLLAITHPAVDDDDIERFAGSLGAAVNAGDSRAVYVDIDDREVRVTGWIGAVDDYGNSLFEFETAEIVVAR